MAATLALLRLARRSLLKAPLRSFLVVLLVGLLVAAGTAFSGVIGSITANEDDLRRSELGNAEVKISFSSNATTYRGGPAGEPWPPEAFPLPAPVPGQKEPGAEEYEAALREQIAEERAWLRAFDFEATVEQLEQQLGTDLTGQRSQRATVEAALGPFGYYVANPTLVDIDRGDPVAAGRLDLIAGRLPTADDEVAVTVARNDDNRNGFAATVDSAIGSTVTHPDQDRTVVGVVADPGSRYTVIDLVTAGAFDKTFADGFGQQPATSFSLFVDERWSESQIRSAVELVSEVVDRPATAQTADTTWIVEQAGEQAFTYNGYSHYRNDSVRVVPILLTTVVGAQVALVAAAAFAVAIRRRTREFAQIATTGGDAGQLRRLVLIEGAVLGFAGAALGIVAGVLIGNWLAPNELFSEGDRYVTSARFDWIDLLLPAAIGIAASLLAAWWPARTIANAPITATLAGHIPTKPAKAITLARGAVVLGIGALLVAVVGSLATSSGLGSAGLLLAAVSILAMLAGSVMIVGPLLSAVGRRADGLPLLGRLIARNSDRHRARSWVVVGAFVATMAVPILVGASIKAYPNSWGGGTETPLEDRLLSMRTASRWGDPFQNDASAIESDAETQAALAQLDRDIGDAAAEIVGPLASAPIVDLPGFDVTAGTDSWRTSYGAALLVATPEIVELFELDQTLIDQLDEDTVLDVSQNQRIASDLIVASNWGTGPRYDVEVLAGPGILDTAMLVSDDFVERLDVSPRFAGTIYRASRPITASDENDIRRAANTLWISEFGPIDPTSSYLGPEQIVELAVQRRWSYGPSAATGQAVSLGITAAIAALIALITAALSAVEVDREMQSMIAVGAKPTMRRFMLGGQTLYHLLIAAAIGIPLALMIFWLATRSDAARPGFVVPWTSIAVMGLVVPVVVAALVAMFFRNGRPAVSRRLS